MAASYGIRPWEMAQLTTAELEDIREHHAATMRERDDG